MIKLYINFSALVFLLLVASCGWAQQWEWQSPYPTHENLIDVAFPDSLHGWAISDNGVIIHTANGGITWELQFTDTALIFADLCAIDSLHSWVVGNCTWDRWGDYGRVLFTSDGGMTWNSRSIRTPMLLKGIDFRDELNGCIVGRNGECFGTIDSGQDWYFQNLRTADHLTAVQFVSDSVGWILGTATVIGYDSYHLLFTTHDGGRSWTVRDTIDDGYYRGMDFTDDRNGWLVGDYGRILHTSDGGATWDLHTVDTPGTIHLTHVDFTNPDVGWAVGFSGVICRTNDGGTTWNRIYNCPSANNANSIAVFDSNHVWLVGNHGMIFRKPDRDDYWRAQTPASSHLNALFFMDRNRGWAVGSGDEIIRTTNGGANWSVISHSDNPNEWRSIWFADSLTGWMIGSSGRIVHTTDGGMSWIKQWDMPSYTLWDIAFADAQIGWAVGNRDANHSGILHTTNGGTEWVEQSPPCDDEFDHIQILSQSALWVSGHFGSLIRTTDSGITWSLHSFGSERSITDISFCSEQVGWAAVRQSGFPYDIEELFCTTNGGVTWRRRFQREGKFFRAIEFVDEMTGWAAAILQVNQNSVVGPVFKTETGGMTWIMDGEQMDWPNQVGVSDIAVVDSENIWIAGQYGAIIHKSHRIPSATTPRSTVSPHDYSLSAYPNPFNPLTVLTFNLPISGPATLTVYDITGRLVQTVAERFMTAGVHREIFNGSRLSSGIYFVCLHSEGGAVSQKIVLLK